MVAPGNVIKLKDNEPGVTLLIPKQSQSSDNRFLGTLIGILGIGISVAIPLLAPEGLAITIGSELIAAGIDLGFQSLAAKVQGTELTTTDYLFSLAGSGAASLSAIRAASIVSKTEKVTAEIARQSTSKGYNKLQFDVITKQAEKAIIQNAGARAVSGELIRAGLTSEETLNILENLSNISRNFGLNVKRFDNEISFIKQETSVFKSLEQVTNKLGLDINETFRVLEQAGIDVVGVQTTHQLARAVRANSKAVYELKANKLFKQLEGALERDLEPTLFTRVLNAKNAERSINKVNKVLSLSNPNTLVSEVTNKVFDPLKVKVEEKALTPFKKKARQKLKQLIRQDLVRKQETKNGVYPCFGSSWINYLRAVPLTKGVYKCRVVFRKWGYTPVTITPELDLQTIINWSESASPGRIYHGFRKEFAGPRGLFTVDEEKPSFKANTASMFNLLGFIPSKYISLGVSLVGNVATARSAASMDTWSNFFKSKDNLFRPIEDKGLEIVGGQFAKAGRDQLLGNRQAMQSYFSGRVTESLESRESEYRKANKEGRGNLDSVKSVTGIIK